jgi:UDP-N-acetyl-D-mannosaminuronic acid transferase (WecB/TagA/CpsF family)
LRIKYSLIPSINHSYCIAEQDNNLKALQQSDILLPDGVAIVAVRMLSGESQQRLPGRYSSSSGAVKGGSCFV